MERQEDSRDESSLEEATPASWKNFTEDEYNQMADSLVHFSSKTVNSNSAAGVRLSSDAGIQLPYVAARTLLGAGKIVDLDYLEGGAAQAGKMKQINAVIRRTQLSDIAPADEREAIIRAIDRVSKAPYATGLEMVDSRLRQLLVPKDDAPGGYVSVTPITSSGVCDYLLNSQDGLVAKNNLIASSEKDGVKTRRKISRARFGIGGANPQNVGSLVRSMKRPIIVFAPNSSSSIKQSLSLYHRGVSLNINARSPVWPILTRYREFREVLVKDGSGASPSQLREQEREIVADLCKAIIDIGREALATLENNAQYLPREHLIGGAIGQRYEMVSRSVSGVVRGLIDPELRDVDYQRASSGRQMDWPREVGELLVSRIIAVKINANGASVPLIPLDRLAINSLISMIEDFLK